jgi:hypothetical protein
LTQHINRLDISEETINARSDHSRSPRLGVR